jgi:signal transduction histidine kinase
MLGFAQLLNLNSEEPLTLKQRSHLSQVERAGQHMQLLIDDLLDLSRIDAGQVNLHLGMVPLRPLLEQSVEMLELVAAEMGVNLERPHVECGLFVWADELRFNQILMNLLSNAVKYNHRGGIVWITVQADGAETVDGRARKLNIAVHDTGEGISAEGLSHLFEPFNRLGQENGRTEGTGLGLVLSQALAQSMQGQIEAYSKPGVGTELVLRLNYEQR